MSLSPSLPSGIDDLLTEKLLNNARLVIREAAALLQVDSVFPKVSMLTHLSQEQKRPIQEFDDLYRTMSWDSVRQHCSEIERLRVIVPYGFTGCQLLSTVMTVSDPKLYSTLVEATEQEPANGDIYIGLAALKASELYLSDSAALLELARACPIYHHSALEFMEEKLAWIRESYQSVVIKLSLKLKEPGLLTRAKREIPSLKDASSELEAAIKEFKNATEEERYRLTNQWQQNPDLRTLARFTSPVDVDQLETDSQLMKLPDNVLDKLLKLLDSDSARKMSLLSPLALKRVQSSPAWCCLSARLMRIPTSQCDKSDFDYTSFAHLCELLRVSQSLKHANPWDPSSFNTLNYSYLAHNIDMSELSLSQPPEIISFHSFLEALKSYILGDKTGFGTHFLVSNSDLHLTLAKMSYTLSDVALGLTLEVLTTLLDSPALGAPLWTKQLKEMGYAYLLASMIYSDPQERALGLSAFIEYHHLIESATTVKHLSEELDLRLEKVDAGEDVDPAEMLVAGVWHLLWCPHSAWAETGSIPFYATFRVEPSDITVFHREEDARAEKQATKQIDYEMLTFASPAPDSSDVCFKGTGKSDQSDQFLVKAKYVGKAISLQFRSSESATPTNLLGYSFSLGFCGAYDFFESPWESTDNDRNGHFLLWKSSALDTESNWNREIEEIDALKALRTSGEVFKRKSRIAAPLRLPDSEMTLHKSKWRSQFLIARENFRLPTSEMQVDQLKQIRNAFPRRVTIPSNALSGQLAQGRFELQEIYNMRQKLFFIQLQETDGLVSKWMSVLANPSYYHDLKVIISALHGHYVTVRNDFELRLSNNPQEAREADLRIKDLSLLFGSNLTADDLDHLIAAAEPCFVALDKVSKRESKLAKESMFDAVAFFLNLYVNFYDKRSNAHLYFRSQSVARVMGRIFGNKIETCVPPSACVSCPETGKSISQRLIDDIKQEDEQTEVVKVYNKWSRLVLATSPALNPYARTLCLEELCFLLACVYTPEMQKNLSNAGVAGKKQAKRAIKGPHFKPDTAPLQVSVPVILGTVVAVVATVTATAFVLGKWFPSKRQN